MLCIGIAYLSGFDTGFFLLKGSLHYWNLPSWATCWPSTSLPPRPGPPKSCSTCPFAAGTAEVSPWSTCQAPSLLRRWRCIRHLKAVIKLRDFESSFKMTNRATRWIELQDESSCKTMNQATRRRIELANRTCESGYELNLLHFWATIVLSPDLCLWSCHCAGCHDKNKEQVWRLDVVL